MDARRLQLKHFAGAGVFYSDFEELPSQSPKTVAEYREALVLCVPAPLGCFQLVGELKEGKILSSQEGQQQKVSFHNK